MSVVQESLPQLHEILLSLLRKGKENAIASKMLIAQLSALGYDLGSDPTREIRDVIHFLRLQGHPICASNSEPMGYYLAETPDELWEYIQRELERLREQAKPIAALRRVYRRWVNEVAGQHRLEVEMLTEAGKALLAEMSVDLDVNGPLERLAQRLYTRCFLHVLCEYAKYDGSIALEWLLRNGITEQTCYEWLRFVKRGEQK